MNQTSGYPLWPRKSLLRPPPPFTVVASYCPLTLIVASHCLPLLLPSMVGCCVLPCSIICCLLHCPPLSSLTLSLAAATTNSFWSASSSFPLPPFLRQHWSSLPPQLLTLAPCHAPLVLWCGCLSSILTGCFVASCHATASCLPAPPPIVSPLPLVICPDWLLRCHIRLSLRHHLQSTWASTYFYPSPPPHATNFLCRPNIWSAEFSFIYSYILLFLICN